MKKILLITILGFISCENNYRSIYLKTDNVNGLIKKSKIMLRGYNVGAVEEIKLTKNGDVILNTRINKSVKIPSDSKFIIGTEGLLDSKKIMIVEGISKNENNFENAAMKIIPELKTKNNDSILIQLDLINQKLEKIDKKLEEMDESK